MDSLTAQAFDPENELVAMRKERFERMSHAELVDVVMGLLKVHSEVKAERDMLRRRVCRIDLGSFCDTVPEFAPLGGGRPDCAVVMGQLVSQYDTESMKMCGAAGGCHLPPDVVDTGMAFLCAPVLITSLDRKLDVKSPHDTVACRLQLETAEELKLVSKWIPQYGKLKLSFSRRSAILETPEGFLSRVAVPMSIDLSAVPCATLNERFAAYSAVTDARFSAALKEIGDRCFSGCQRLATIDLTSTSVSVLPRSFAGYCAALTDVRFPSTLEKVCGFFKCHSLGVLDLTSTRLKIIEDGFAVDCATLTDVRFPSTLEEIGDDCFTIYESGCESLTVLDLSSTRLKAIGHRFAAECAALTDVRFPATLRGIGDRCFSKCENLAVLDLTSTCLKIIGHRFAEECAALTDVRFPVTLEETGGHCFYICKSLATIDLSATQLRRFGTNFAARCPQLELSAGVLVPDTFHITADLAHICRHANKSTIERSNKRSRHDE